MDRERFIDIANDALTEVLTELGYKKEDFRKICGWFDFVEPYHHEEAREHCIDFGDGREGYHPICIPKQMNGDDAKEETKRQLREHGIIPSDKMGYKP